MDDRRALYKRYIDGLVKLGKSSSSAEKIRLGQWQGDTTRLEGRADHDNYARLVNELSPEQRQIMADLVQRERLVTIRDMLSFLTNHDYRLSQAGTDLAHEPYGTEMYLDFMARVGPSPWPDEEEKK